MFCSNCGTELGEGTNFCSNCGRSVSDKPVNGTPSVASNGNMRYRHGFTSFWLWSQLIFSIILFLVFALGDANWIAAYFDLSGSGRGIIIISMVAYALAEILMIKWRRLGFYIWAAVPVALIFLDPFGQGFILNLIGAGISIGILFAILRIRNKHNGKSTWEQMGDGKEKPKAGPTIATVVLALIMALIFLGIN